MKKIILIIFLFLSIYNLQSQFTQVPLKLVNASNVPLTGQAGNITFRKSPYGGGDGITGLTVTEVGVTGNYIITGFTTYQQSKLYINGVEQTWWGIQWTGNATMFFGIIGAWNHWSGFNTFMNPYMETGSPLYTNYSDANFFDNTLVFKKWVVDQYGNLAGNNNFTGLNNFGGMRLTNIGDATIATDALNRNIGDGRYLRKDISTETGNKVSWVGTFPQAYSYSGDTAVYLAPANNFDLTPKKYVDTKITNIGDGRYLRKDIFTETVNKVAWVGTFPQAYSYSGDTAVYLAPANNFDLTPKKYVDDNAGVEPNTIIVDGNLAADVTGKKYRTISSAITYIAASGAPTASNIWSIFIYPKKAGYYTDSFAWADYINIYGVGKVVIKNTLTYSLFVRTGLHFNNKTKDITWVQSDQTLFFNKMLLFNCAFVADSRGENFGRLEIGSSTFRDCDIFYDYTDNYFTNDGNNRIMDCNFNTDMTAKFITSDKIYGWKFVTADAIDY